MSIFRRKKKNIFNLCRQWHVIQFLLPESYIFSRLATTILAHVLCTLVCTTQDERHRSINFCRDVPYRCEDAVGKIVSSTTNSVCQRWLYYLHVYRQIIKDIIVLCKCGFRFACELCAQRQQSTIRKNNNSIFSIFWNVLMSVENRLLLTSAYRILLTLNNWIDDRTRNEKLDSEPVAVDVLSPSIRWPTFYQIFKCL